MRLHKLSFYVSLVTALLVTQYVRAEFTVPIQRLERANESANDLAYGNFNVRALDTLSNSFSGWLSDSDSDSLFDWFAASVSTVFVEAEIYISTPTPVNAITTLGEIDSLFYGDVIIDPEDGVDSFVTWGVISAGVVEFEVLEPEEEITEGLTLRTNLWGAFETSSFSDSENGNFLFAQITNVRSGENVILSGWRHPTADQWLWFMQNQFGDMMFSSTAGGMNEFYYDELYDVMPGDVIRITIRAIAP